MEFLETVLWPRYFEPTEGDYCIDSSQDETPIGNHDFQNHDFQNHDFQNHDFQNHDFQNLDFQNLDFQNHDEASSFFSTALEEYHSSQAVRSPSPPATAITLSLPSPPSTTYRPPTIFSTYHTLRHIIPGHPEGGWMLTHTRTIFEHDSSTMRKSGRSIPPPVHFGDWNVWTVGDVSIRSTKGGLHLNFLREVLKRTDGIQRGKWGRKVLESGIVKERCRQVSKGLVVDRPQNWSEGGGWWVYVQPV